MRRTDLDLEPMAPTFAELFLPIFRPGERILAAARRFADAPTVAASCAQDARYRSVNPRITEGYLGRPKDAVFAADTLYAAGFAPPVAGGCCRDPVLWPDLAELFLALAPGQAARCGDLLLVDGHVEIIVSVARGAYVTLGARRHGLVEDASHTRALREGRCVVLRPRLDAPI